MRLIHLLCLWACRRGDPPLTAQVGIKISKISYVVFLLCLVLEHGGSRSAFRYKRYCIECSIRGQDLTLAWTLLMRWNRRQREAPRPWGGLQGGMLLTLQTKRARPQSSSILSLIRKKDSLGAPSPTRRSICAQAELNWYIFPHYSRRPLLCVPPAMRPSKGRRETERHWG